MQLHAVFFLPYKAAMVSSRSTPASPGTAKAGFCCMLPVCAVGPALFWLAVQNSCFHPVQIPAGKFCSGYFCKALGDSVRYACSYGWGFILHPPPSSLDEGREVNQGPEFSFGESFWPVIDAFCLKSSLVVRVWKRRLDFCIDICFT